MVLYGPLVENGCCRCQHKVAVKAKSHTRQFRRLYSSRAFFYHQTHVESSYEFLSDYNHNQIKDLRPRVHTHKHTHACTVWGIINNTALFPNTSLVPTAAHAIRSNLQLWIYIDFTTNTPRLWNKYTCVHLSHICQSPPPAKFLLPNIHSYKKTCLASQ